jgi:hypothetical protein
MAPSANESSEIVVVVRVYMHMMSASTRDVNASHVTTTCGRSDQVPDQRIIPVTGPQTFTGILLTSLEPRVLSCGTLCLGACACLVTCTPRDSSRWRQRDRQAYSRNHNHGHVTRHGVVETFHRCGLCTDRYMHQYVCLHASL